MSYGSKILAYYTALQVPQNLPDGVEVLYPFKETEVKSILQQFYNKYFDDNNDRVFLIGINPGRFGSGATGIPFTDPIRLAEELGITNSFTPKAELSSRFIYDVINYMGGSEYFYKNFYFTSVSPVGFTMNGKNLNYYDIPELQDQIESYMVEEMRKQIAFGAKPIAFSLGMGKNIAYLKKLNKKHNLFKEIRPLPHPRWVMQYRLKRKDEFIDQYKKMLTEAI